MHYCCCNHDRADIAMLPVIPPIHLWHAEHIPLFSTLMPSIAAIDVFTMDALMRLDSDWLSNVQLNLERRRQQEIYLMLSFMSALRCSSGGVVCCERGHWGQNGVWGTQEAATAASYCCVRRIPAAPVVHMNLTSTQLA
jgi:hypothetical protein